MVHVHAALAIFVATLLSPLLEEAQAAESAITVTATRLETPEEQAPGSLTVINGEEIRRRQARDVYDLLRDVPGISVSNQGGPGRATSVFLRGLNPEHVLVLVDGVKMNDPLNPARAFDFGSLSVENIERIEVLRGAGSMLYGSDAMGGVIQIITKRGRGPFRATVDVEYGAYQTFLTRGTAQGGDRSVDYTLGVELQGTQGFSSADEALGNTEKDGRTMWTLSGKSGGEWLSGVRADLSGRYTYSRFDSDFSGGPSGDDPNYTGELKEFSARLQAKPARVSVWEPIGYVDLLVNQRRADNDPDPVHPDILHGNYASSRVGSGWQNNFYFSESHTLLLGAEFETEGGTSTETTQFGTTALGDQRASSFAILGEDQWSVGWLSATGGARIDAYDRFGTAATYRLAPTFVIGHFVGSTLSFKGSVGTGFKAPSLYQLYAPIFGNAALQPERVLSWEVGPELRWAAARASVTYFNNALENLITGQAPSFLYVNIGRARTDGVEAAFSVDAGSLSTGLSYTWLETSDLSTGLPLLRRPAHEFSIREEYLASDRLKLGATERYVGTRADLDAVTFARKDLAAYFLMNLDARYALSKDFRAFARIENLLDAQYEEIDGYGTARRSLYAGLSKDF